MKTLFPWLVSIGILLVGLAAMLTVVSLLKPATNPMSDAAARFQGSVILGTLFSALVLVFSEVTARRLSAPPGGWGRGWFLIGGLFLVLGTSLLLGALQEDGRGLGHRTHDFRLRIGALYVVLGVAGFVGGMGSRPGSSPPV